jgi:hypothetical protein
VSWNSRIANSVRTASKTSMARPFLDPGLSEKSDVIAVILAYF